MRRNFNIRMALTNIKNNQNIYLPYFMAASLIVMLFYSLRSVSFMVANSTAAGGIYHERYAADELLDLRYPSLVILFYVNSFIMKRRKKSLAFTAFWVWKNAISAGNGVEVLITGAIGIFAVLCWGRCSASFVFLLKIVSLPVALEFVIPFQRRRQHLYCSALAF